MRKEKKTVSPSSVGSAREKLRRRSAGQTSDELLFHSYTYFDDEGVFPEVQFAFDLELPPDFRPTIGDGEVQEFYLLPIRKVSVRGCGRAKAFEATWWWSPWL